MRPRTSLRILGATAALALGVFATAAPSAAGPSPRVTLQECAGNPWTQASFQAASTPSALASLVLSCLQEEDPSTYVADEVGIATLENVPTSVTPADAWFENMNELGTGSSVQKDLAALGIPPLTLEDGPGGLITAVPADESSPTHLTNELALGATFDTSLATKYGTVLGSEAHAMGYDGVQAPDLNLLRTPTWGRAMESFGESPVLAGELGAAEAVAIGAQDEIPVLKHFGPYSQDTNRQILDQEVSTKALLEVYDRPFTFALHALAPQLAEGGHAVAVMCSYGNVNGTRECLTPLLAQELARVGVDALVRTDQNVEATAASLLLNGVDLVKPLDESQLDEALGDPGVMAGLNRAAQDVLATEFADGLVDGSTTDAPTPLPASLATGGQAVAEQVEEHAAVLLKDDAVLPLTPADRRVVVLDDGSMTSTCGQLAASLAHALGVTASCADYGDVALTTTTLFGTLPNESTTTTRATTYHAQSAGPYVLGVSTWGNTSVTLDGHTALSTRGLAQFRVARSAQVTLAAGNHTVRVTWSGYAPRITLTDAAPEVAAARSDVAGASVAVVLAYDVAMEGMDRDSLALPGAQDAVLAAVGAKVHTVAVLATDGAVTMPWLSAMRGVLEVWNPTGAAQLDGTLAPFVPAWTAVLDGAYDPSGRLPVTFPAALATSPAGVTGFWPGEGLATTVDLGLAPYDGVGIGMAWYRTARWPVLFPFGYGLSYDTTSVRGGTLRTSNGSVTLTVRVRASGTHAATVPVEVYADWPAADGEPRLQLVGFTTASFTAPQAAAGTVRTVTVGVSPDALAVDDGGTMQLATGSYCFEAAAYAGDPKAWGTGSVPFAADGGGLTAPTRNLVASPCPS